MAFLMRTRALRVLASTVLACGVVARVLSAQAQPAALETNIKAVFLFNFSKYVSWPSMKVGERSPAELRICVTANDGFFATLKNAVEGEYVEGKPLLPIVLDGLDEARNCQILFVGTADTADARAWLSSVRNAQVLTVAEGALSDDTVIAFVRDENRIRFDINRAAAARRGLNVSSKLLRLARRVRDQ
jgi:hypothetical protein